MTGLVIGFAVGIVSSALVAIAVIYFISPSLTFTPQTGDVAGPHDWTDGKSYRFVHVVVENAHRPWWQRWRDTTANYARCFVEFKDPTSREVLMRINGRWASGGEPFVAGALDFSKLVVPQREILVIGETFSVDVALKYEGDEYFYAFNNESYLPADELQPAWAHTDKCLFQDHVLVEVEIWAEGARARSGDFALRNPNVSLANFKLE